MHALFAEVPNLVTSTRGGDIFIIAAGVAIGVTAANMVRGFVRWALGDAREKDLEKVIVKAIEKAEPEQAEWERAERQS